VTSVLYLKTAILVIVDVEKTTQVSVKDSLARLNINGTLVHAQCGRVFFRPRLWTLYDKDLKNNIFKEDPALSIVYFQSVIFLRLVVTQKSKK
jgi:hypothetical protein